jgi:hypothetical protein
MSKGLEFFLFEGFEDISGNDTTTTDASGNDTTTTTTTNTDISGNDTTTTTNTNTEDITTDASGNNTTTDASGNNTTTDASGNNTSTDASGNDTSTSDNNDSTLNIILTYENLYLLFWVISFYFIFYSLLAFFFTRDSLGYVYDVIIIITIGLMSAAYWFFESDTDTKDEAQGVADRFLSFFEDKYNAVYIVGSLILVYLVVYLFKIPTDPETKPTIIVGLETLLFILLVLVLFCLGFKEFMEVSLPEELRKHLGITKGVGEGGGRNTVLSQIQNNASSGIRQGSQKEVFNVGGNHYTYSDAEAICKSFDSELADYDQIENSYNNGGEWCNYGWSKDQMALFPTQKSTWNKLQDNDKTKNNCGRPGINGGFMANPALRFGVNCYGKKPDKRDIDYVPITHTESNPEEEKDNAAVQFWKNNQDKLKLNYYNSDKWSRV